MRTRRDPTRPEASVLLLVIAASGLAIIVGLAMHVARAIVVREPLWEGRYRGPSVLALLVLAIIAANAASVSVANDVLAVTQGRPPSTIGVAGPAHHHPSGASWPWRASSWPRRAPWRASASFRSAGSCARWGWACCWPSRPGSVRSCWL